jgi:hypothetical protein
MTAAMVWWMITNWPKSFVLNYHSIISQRDHCNTQNNENSGNWKMGDVTCLVYETAWTKTGFTSSSRYTVSRKNVLINHNKTPVFWIKLAILHRFCFFFKRFIAQEILRDTHTYIFIYFPYITHWYRAIRYGNGHIWYHNTCLKYTVVLDYIHNYNV